MLPKIIKAPSSILTTPTTNLSDIDGSIVRLSRTMGLVLRSSKGAGLAANQIGYTYSMFVYLEDGKLHTAINPVILNESELIQTGDEGCLSIPNKTFKIERPSSVEIKYLNLDGEEITKTGQGFMARLFMHEMDHLNGILIWQ